MTEAVDWIGLATGLVAVVIGLVGFLRSRVARTLLLEALKHPSRGTRIDRLTGNTVPYESSHQAHV